MNLFSELPRGPYQVILADPPWSYRGQVQHGGKDKPFTSSAGSFYDVVSIEDLCTLPVRDIADPLGSICFMCTTGPILEDSLQLMKAWGFKYKQIPFVWNKHSDYKVVDHMITGYCDVGLLVSWTESLAMHPNLSIMHDEVGGVLMLVESGKDQVNPGAYTMTSCEFVLVGTRKRIPTPRGARNIRQFMQAPRTVHSAKPEEIRRRIDLMFPNQKKLELFARREVQGWDAWGNEVGIHG